MNLEYQNLYEMLLQQALDKPDKIGIEVVEKDLIHSLSFKQLYLHSVALAEKLIELCPPKSRIIIMYPTSTDYVISFFACAISGMIAVPVYPPINALFQKKIADIIQDCQPDMILCSKEVLKKLRQSLLFYPLLRLMKTFKLNYVSDDALLFLKHLKWSLLPSISYQYISNTPVKMDTFFAQLVKSNDLAFLQYTSGTTGNSKGVMVSHQNILHNCKMINYFFKHDTTTRGVSWLPPYHDMGLIGNIIHPIYIGFKIRLLSPFDFLKNPLIWLKHISLIKATSSGAPNFAYAICLRIPDNGLDIDLSSWDNAFCGAEKIRNNVLIDFEKKYAKFGFRPNVFLPCYGLAEHTLIVSGKNHARADEYVSVERNALFSENRIVITKESSNSINIASCGSWDPQELELKIIAQNSLEALADLAIGRVVVSSKSVTQGYWEKEALSRQVFALLIEGKEFMDTGDLGFIYQNNLYIIGRSKEAIILNGINYYSEPIEHYLEEKIPEILPSKMAIIQLEHENESRVAVVIEPLKMDNSYLQHMGKTICREILVGFGLVIHSVYFVGKRFIPRTSSGKISRVKLGYLLSEKDPKVLMHYQPEKEGMTLDAEKITEQISIVTPDVIWDNIVIICAQFGVNNVRKTSVISELFPSSLMQLELLIRLEHQVHTHSLPYSLLIDNKTLGELQQNLYELLQKPQIESHEYKLLPETFPALPLPQFIYERYPKDAFNIGYVCEAIKPIDILQMKKALLLILQSQPVLRSRFIEKSKSCPLEPPEIILDKVFACEKIKCHESEIEKVIEDTVTRLSDSIHPDRYPLFKVVHLTHETTAKEYVVSVFHHALVDPFSMNFFFRNLDRLLEFPNIMETLINKNAKERYDEFFSIENFFNKDSEGQEILFHSMHDDVVFKLDKDNIIRNESIYSYPVSSNDYHELKKLADHNKLNFDTLLLMWTLSALEKQITTGGLVQYIHNGRSIFPGGKPVLHLMGWFNTSVPLQIPQSKEPLFSRIIQLQEQLAAVQPKAWEYCLNQRNNGFYTKNGIIGLDAAKIEFSNVTLLSAYSGHYLKPAPLMGSSANGTVLLGKTFDKFRYRTLSLDHQRYREIYIRPVINQDTLSINIYYQKGKINIEQIERDLSYIQYSMVKELPA